MIWMEVGIVSGVWEILIVVMMDWVVEVIDVVQKRVRGGDIRDSSVWYEGWRDRKWRGRLIHKSIGAI